MGCVAVLIPLYNIGHSDLTNNNLYGIFEVEISYKDDKYRL
jgi:hypothetical protein